MNFLNAFSGSLLLACFLSGCDTSQAEIKEVKALPVPIAPASEKPLLEEKTPAPIVSLKSEEDKTPPPEKTTVSKSSTPKIPQVSVSTKGAFLVLFAKDAVFEPFFKLQSAPAELQEKDEQKRSSRGEFLMIPDKENLRLKGGAKSAKSADVGDDLAEATPLKEEEPEAGALPGKAVFTFETALEGEYHLFARVFWTDCCGNSFFVRLDGEEGDPTLLFGEDPVYGVYHWVEMIKPVRLKKGQHQLTFFNREDGVRLDQVFITNTKTKPAGIEAP